MDSGSSSCNAAAHTMQFREHQKNVTEAWGATLGAGSTSNNEPWL
jgi:hypothetical protein